MTDVISFLILLAIFIILLTLNSFIRQYIKQNNFDLKNLQRTLNNIKDRLNDLEVSDIKKSVQEENAWEKYQPKPKTEEVTYFESILETEEEEQEKPIIEEVFNEKKKFIDAEKITPKVKTPEPKIIKPRIVKEKKSFFDKYPDLEKFIGENLINKIGIVILVLGLAFFVRYAIDRNWINEIGRVVIGILCAGGLIALAHRMRKNYKSFSSVLIGGGLALLYFTITLAFHTKGYPLYQEQTISFIILVFITMFAVFLSIAYDRIEIAIFAILGGFASPLLISNGSGNYIVLFSYLMILNVGMLVLSYYKKWRLVNIVSFGFTVLLFASWLAVELIDERYTKFSGAIFYATGFYVIFFLMNIIYNIKHNIKFKAGDITIILCNTFIYFAFVMLMLPYIHNGAYKGLFAILLAAFNFAFAYYSHTRKEKDSNLLFLLIGLVLTFVTLAIPLQLKGNYITLFWAAEGVLLLWLGQKSEFKIMKLGSVIVSLLMLISISMDWQNNYLISGYFSEDYIKQLGFLFNKMFLTTLVSGVSLIAVLLLLKKEKENIAWLIPIEVYKAIILCLMFFVFYIGGLSEANYQAFHYFIEYSSKGVVVSTFNALFILVLLVFAHKMNNRNISITVSVLSVFFILYFLVSLSVVYAGSALIYISGSEIYSTILLVLRWISVFAVYAIGILLFRLLNKINNNARNELYKLNIAVLIFTFLFLLSADLDTITILITKSKQILIQVHKAGYAILWGLSSFILMMIGMKKKEQFIRIISLVLFAITIIKLFVYDITNINEGGKIVAFVLLGILLLIISFMYQKVKKLLLDDDSVMKKSETEIETPKD